MNSTLHTIVSGSWLKLGAAFVVLLSQAHAQELPPPLPPPEDYLFQMRVPAGTDILVTQTSSDKETSPPNKAKTDTQGTTTILRAVRKPIVVEEIAGQTESKSTRYYMKGWCAYDDARKGLNVRRTCLETMYPPLYQYHFPELLWAIAETQQPTSPNSNKDKKELLVFEQGQQRLEVDRQSKLPKRYTTPNREYLYEYRRPGKKVRLPSKIKEGLLHSLKANGRS